MQLPPNVSQTRREHKFKEVVTVVSSMHATGEKTKQIKMQQLNQYWNVTVKMRIYLSGVYLFVGDKRGSARK